MRLTAYAGGVSLGLLALILSVGLELTIREAWGRADRALHISFVSIEAAASEAIWTFDVRQAERLAEGLTASPFIRSAEFVDGSGGIVVHTSDPVGPKERLSRSLLTGYRPDLDHGYPLVRRSMLPGEADQVVGALRVKVDYAALHASVVDRFLQIVWAVVPLSILLMTSIFVIALLTAARPLRRLAEAIRETGGSLDPGALIAGDLVHRDDEIGQVARGFASRVRDLAFRTREAEEAQIKLRNILDGSLQAIVVHRNFELLFVNEAAARMFGYVDAAEMLDLCDLRRTFVTAPNGTLDGFVDLLARDDLDEAHLANRVRIRRDGTRFVAEVAGRRIRWQGEWAVQTALIDVTARVRAEQELRVLATRDGLTHLPNKTLFLEQLGFALRDVRPGGIGVLFVNVKRMKGFNDALGLAGGDELLRKVGERLRSQLFGRAMLAKFPGDKFAVLMPDMADESDLITLGQRFDDDSAVQIEIGGQSVHATLSYGAAVWPFDGRTPEELVLSAERACTNANMRRARRVVFSNPEMNQEAARRYEIEHRLSQALAAGRLEVHYQPKVHARDERLVGAEALIRWPADEGSHPTPGEFIPVAEATGQILELGRYVVRKVCADQHRLVRETGLLVPVAVNVSAFQFQNDDMLRIARQALEAHQLPPSALELEVTESATMEQIDEVIPMLAALRAFGIRIAIDDFGTGYSSLSHLKRLPVDFLKLDRSFTRDVHGGDGRSIASAIVGLGHALGLTVIAEGVETDDEAAVLRDLGYDEFQGFHYGRPMPIEQYREWIRERRAVIEVSR